MAIVINNMNFRGNNVTISNGKIIIDGKDVTGEFPEEKSIKINVEGNLNSLNVDNCDYVEVGGDVEQLECRNGNVSCKNVKGSVHNRNGNILCGDVKGNVSNRNGTISRR